MSKTPAETDSLGRSFASRYYRQYVLKETSANTSRTRQRVEMVLDMIGQNRGSLLSVGAGNLTEAMALNEAGFEVAVVDVTDSQFDRARSAGMTPYLADLDRDEIPGTYDVVCCLEVIEHLVDSLAAIKKLVRCLAPGGRLFVSLPDEFHIVSRLEILAGRPRFSRYDWHHLRFFNRRSAGQLFTDAGLRIVQVRHVPIVPPRWPRPVQGMARVLANIAPGLFSLSHVFELEPMNCPSHKSPRK